MPLQTPPVKLLPLLALPALLGSCAIGAYFSPISALERSVNGLYEGEGNGVTGRVPYRLTLTLQEQAGRVSGVLTNLESKKTYTGSGSFRRTQAGGQELLSNGRFLREKFGQVSPEEQDLKLK